MRADVILGDCLDVMRTMPAASVDAVITDPPYSSGGSYRADRMQTTTAKYVQTGQVMDHGEFSGDNRDQRSYLAWSWLWMSQAFRILKSGCPFCVFADWRQMPTTTDAVQAAGFVWRGVAVWDKTEAVRPQKGRFRSQAEYIVWGSKGPMPTDDDAPCLPGVFRRGVERADKYHIAGKPRSLMADLCRICPPGGIIFDPFCGSGSTGAAAAELGYGFVGIETDERHHAIARRRIANVAPLFAGGAA